MNSDQDSGKVIQDSGKDSPPPNSGHSSNQSAPEYYTSSDNENGIAPPPKYSRGYFNEAFQSTEYNQPIRDVRRPSQAHMDSALNQFRNDYGVQNVTFHERMKYHKHSKKKSNRTGSELAQHEEVNEPLPPQEQVQVILGDVKNLSGDVSGKDTPCLFTEMVHLKTEDGHMIWKEKARWLKFEESVEEGGDRWSKPHVSTLSLHSVFELRSCILNGVILLDMVAKDFVQIADLILEHLISNGHLPHDDELHDKVRAALLCGHEHQGENRKGLTHRKSIVDFMARRNSDAHLKSYGLARHNTSTSLISKSKSFSLSGSASTPQMEMYENDKKSKVPYFMKKIPPGSEAANVLVGEVDFLEQRIIAFVRLQDSINLGRLTEVPIPTKFVFFLLEPSGNLQQYHEIGRSIATLLNDEVFHEVAYKAKTRKDLLAGIDEFMDQVTLLPPGEWDSKIRIEPPKELPSNQKNRLLSVTQPAEDEFHSHECPPELKRTGRLFGGLINDVKRKAPFYWSDFRDCLSMQCLASFLFLYFAILTANVTFGGLLGDATDNYVGTVESLFGAAISGTCYHLFSGQPLTIIGSTGPILVFETILFELCTALGMEYISFRFWVGAWTGIICIFLVALDVSSLITYVTRFTEESFSALISFIFIYEAFKKLASEGDKLHIWYGWDPNQVTLYQCDCQPPDLSTYNITSNLSVSEMIQTSIESSIGSHSKYQLGKLYKYDNDSYLCVSRGEVHNISNVRTEPWSNLTKKKCLEDYCGDLVGDACKYTPDAVFMSILLFFGTFAISMGLKSLKTSRYFPTKARSIVSDFAVTIGIGSMVLFDILMGINTTKLAVPSTFRPTREDRGWIIDPIGSNPWWSILLAIVPALLATILVFMDQQITAVIVNRKENKLKKACGYHLDLLIVAIMLIVCSLLGLPWFVAATVRSINHVNSLKMESESNAPGEAPKFLGVREQRVTGTVIFLMIGLSVLLTPVLAYVPMPVLYGVFLYMGVSSLNGVQFFDRIKLFFMPPKHQPDFIYLRHVPLPKVYLFTALQLICFAIMWVIKSISPVSIVFPMMVAALVGIRKLFDYGLFTQQDLMWLDDLMPESTKKKKEDARKKKEAEAKLVEDATVDVPIDGGKVLKIPVTGINYNRRQSVNITKEMAQTAIWKNLTHKNDSGEMRQRIATSKKAQDVAVDFSHNETPM